MENKELHRIRQRYQQRDHSNGETRFWTLQNPVVVHMAQERERLMLSLLAKYQIDLASATILDVGCGMGGEFVNYLRWGAYKDNIVGVDLMFERLRAAKLRLESNVINASGDRLPFMDDSFDVIFQTVVFTSIIDPTVKKKIAAEMMRVLRPGGYVIWYDAVRSRSKDPHYRAIPKSEVSLLFPELRFDYYTLTTDQGLLRLTYKVLGALGLKLLALFPLFRTHAIAVGRKLKQPAET